MAAEPVNASTATMTIGRFSEATRLSLKALRLYDAMGLLPPARIDEATGYRYYLDTQVRSARLIFVLRQLDMPLQIIAAVLEQSGFDAARMLETYWRTVESDTVMKRKLVAHVGAILKGESQIMHQVQTRYVEEQKLLSIESRTLADRLPSVIQSSGDKLMARARATGIDVTGPALVIYHGQVSMDADGPVEVCLPVSGSVEPFADARVRLEPAHHEAYARINKSEVVYPDILRAYESVENWLKLNGKRMAGPPREVMFADWHAISDDDPACDISWPYTE